MHENKGTIVQVMGPVVDVAFPEGDLPEDVYTRQHWLTASPVTAARWRQKVSSACWNRSQVNGLTR